MTDALNMRDALGKAPGDLLVVVGGIVLRTMSGVMLAPRFDDVFFVIASWHETSKKGVKLVDPALLLLHLRTGALVRIAPSETWWLKKL